MPQQITSPDDLTYKLIQYEDPETAVAVYKEAAGFAAAYKEVMDAARQFISSHITSTGEIKGRTAIGTFGLTRPKQKWALDTESWIQAAQGDSVLQQTQNAFEQAKARYEAAQKALQEAQNPFMTLDVTPEGRPYIR